MRTVQARTAYFPVLESQVAYSRRAYTRDADALQACDQPTGEQIKMSTMVAERKSGYDHGYNHIARIKNHGAPSSAAPEDWYSAGITGIKMQLYFRSTT